MERRRIAQDLHDGVVQDLAGVSYSVAAAANRAELERGDDASRLSEAASRLRQSVRDLRGLLVEIYPPTCTARASAPRSPTSSAASMPAACMQNRSVPDDLELPSEIETLFFRISQEAVRNVVAHAEAENLMIRVSSAEERARLEVSDDGRGFSPDPRRRRPRPLRPADALRPGRRGRRRARARLRAGPGDADPRGGAAAMISVLLVEDHPVVRAGLEDLLSGTADIEVCGSVEDGAAAVEQVAATEPDVILMDISMPVMDGIEATRQITAADPEARIVILTSFSDQKGILEAIDAGAIGYLLKDAAPEELFRGVRAAAEGESPLAPTAARALLRARQAGDGPEELTEREREVLALVGAGLPNKLIARRLEISEKTVKTHLTSVYRRIGVDSRTEAALWAQQRGLTDER